MRRLLVGWAAISMMFAEKVAFDRVPDAVLDQRLEAVKKKNPARLETLKLLRETRLVVVMHALAPALVKTDMARALWESNEEGAAKMHALKRLGLPDDIASLAVFLCGNASSWMTGETVVIDGGTLL